MTDGSRIHVFVGAPIIALIPPQGICGNTVCDEGGHFYEEHRVHLQCSSPWEHTLCRSGQSLSDPSCYVAGNAAAGQPPFLTGSGDTWPPHRVGASSPQNVCEHVTTKQRPEASLHCDFLELSVSENHQGGSNGDVSHGNYSTSTDAEFLAVLASSQVAVQVHNSKTCQMRGIEKFPFPSFTGLNIDPIENASCKRKTTSMDTLYLTTSSDQISKKPKHTGSLIQHVSKESDNQRPQTAPTLLKNCCDKNKEYNILAVVLQPCHVKEIQAKSRPNSGSFPLATIVVLDQSGVKCKILMWRTAAFWSLALLPGDIIMLKNFTVCKDKWSKETFLQSTFNSSFFNLGNCSLLTTDQYKNVVEYLALQELLYYISTEHCYLQDLPSRPPQQLDCTQHARLSKLHPEVLVHSILKVVSISILKECTYNFNGLEQNKVILTVEEAKGQIGTLILWGKSVSWCEQIRMKRDCIWVFKYLFCKKSLISGDVELHTTPWSSCECLFDDDKRALDFQKRYENVSSPKLLSLRTVLEGKYSGNFQIKVSISEFKFHVPGNQNICVNKQTSITKILSSLPSVIYSGCGNCRKELRIDCNNVYEQCSFCLPFAQIRLFYRPVLMTVRNEGDEIFVHVPSDVLEKIFLNISPNLLHKLVFESSNVTHGAIVADTCHSLLADNSESYLLAIKSHFSLDENSVPLEQEFHVLSFLVNI